MHQQLGFIHVGQMRQVGCKFGRWLDPDHDATDPEQDLETMIPGEYQIQDGDIELNAGRRT